MKINWFKIKMFYLLNFLSSYIIYGEHSSYAYICVYLAQGGICKDCEEDWVNCECNRCEKCKFPYCICDLILKNKSEIKNLFFEFSIRNMSKKLLPELKRKIKDTHSDSLKEDYEIINKKQYKKIIKNIEKYEN